MYPRNILSFLLLYLSLNISLSISQETPTSTNKKFIHSISKSVNQFKNEPFTVLNHEKNDVFLNINPVCNSILHISCLNKSKKNYRICSPNNSICKCYYIGSVLSECLKYCSTYDLSSYKSMRLQCEKNPFLLNFDLSLSSIKYSHHLLPSHPNLSKNSNSNNIDKKLLKEIKSFKKTFNIKNTSHYQKTPVNNIPIQAQPSDLDLHDILITSNTSNHHDLNKVSPYNIFNDDQHIISTYFEELLKYERGPLKSSTQNSVSNENSFLSLLEKSNFDFYPLNDLDSIDESQLYQQKLNHLKNNFHNFTEFSHNLKANLEKIENTSESASKQSYTKSTALSYNENVLFQDSFTDTVNENKIDNNNYYYSLLNKSSVTSNGFRPINSFKAFQNILMFLTTLLLAILLGCILL
ncbi:uncharacterized protein ASCRUDRAFT_8281 [Ascoidea rubescens DSM 1968]|uniref:Extracellular membrane protein CFEM domain-containing protein n=1 Tax=Ascoidea rubescens DSM 1968 TaxID=1344418 RepID=A0A1D2VG59_9ASCO|nr:hypothetical protein ASCRUDRAFT_8281 [Ascoidea rubescens DSM 1968]ODV60664.1 hypothetical protein ASCRUDRAFT_8281 [Ascoidea rubescens DSM 1968]